jgi:hypothetical protein
MGCVAGRTEIPPFEYRFSKGERQLLYWKHEATTIDFVHRKHSFNGMVNENHWIIINRQLNLVLNVNDFSNLAKIKSYYELYKEGECYKLKELLVVGIILSDSRAPLKAGLLYDAFNFQGNPELSVEEIGKMHDILYKICVKRAERIIVDSKKFYVSAEEHKDFVDKMKQGREGFREYFLREIVRDGKGVRRDAFIAFFRDQKNSIILASIGFRKHCRDFGLSKNPTSNPKDMLRLEKSKT